MSTRSDVSLALRPARFLVGLLALASLATVAASAQQQQLPQLTIGAYQLQSSVRVSPTQYDYTYTANVTNSGVTAINVTGTVVSSSPNTLVNSGTVSFGLVPGASTITSTATFTIEQNRLHAFDPSSLSWTFDGTSASTIFAHPVISRLYQDKAYVQKSQIKGNPDLETVAQYAAAVAGYNPSFVDGLIYLNNSDVTSGAPTAQMIADFNTVRGAVLAINPNAKFSIEISLNPAQSNPYASPAALVALMTTLNADFQPDAWDFDFYSNAETSDPDWITQAIAYAHANGQLVGGNDFGSKVPPGSDFISFVDDPSTGSNGNNVPNPPFNFSFSPKEIANLQASSPSTVILGHLQTNAQNGDTTESYVYIYDWSETMQLSYLTYWASGQAAYGFTFMYPIFYPQYPTNYSIDPLQDPSPDGGSLYTDIRTLKAAYNP
jgi:hypothetical protein